VPEVGTAESIADIERPLRWVAPRLLVTEVAATLRRKAAGKELSPLHAADALAATLDAGHGHGRVRALDPDRSCGG